MSAQKTWSFELAGTPGGNGDYQRIINADGEYIASTWGGPNEANARLIAAAPELLAALELVVSKLGDDYELYREQKFAIDTARAAIAKVKGADHA
jgi:hypothetical protein